MTDLLPALSAVLPGVRAKYDRYSAGDPKCIGFSGFKYLLKSSPGLDINEEELTQAFMHGSQEETIKRASILSFDQFIVALRFLSQTHAPRGDQSDRNLLHFLVHFIVPDQMDCPEVLEALDMRAKVPVASKIDIQARTSVDSEQHNDTQPVTHIAVKSEHRSAAIELPPVEETTENDAALVTFLQRGSPEVKTEQQPPRAVTESLSVSHIVRDFVSSLRLGEFIPAFVDLGVERMEDLCEITYDDLTKMGLKHLQARRFLDAVLQWEAEVAKQRSQPVVTSYEDDEWEEYATTDGFVYYHNPRTQATQWQRPEGARVKTMQARHQQQLSIAALVEERVAAVLAKSRVQADTSQGLTETDTPVMPEPPVAVRQEVEPHSSAPSHTNFTHTKAAWRSAWNELLLEGEQSSASAAVRAHEAIKGGWVSPGKNTAGVEIAPLNVSPKPFLVDQQDQAEAAKTSGAAYNSFTGLHENAVDDASTSQLDSMSLTSPPGYLRTFLSQQRKANDVDSVAASTDSAKVNLFGVTLAGDAIESGQYLARNPPRTPARLRDRDNASTSTFDSAALAANASVAYQELYESLPTMDPKTFSTIAKHNMVGTSRIMGYSDPRPDIRPAPSFMPAAKVLSPRARIDAKSSLDVNTGTTGAQCRADGVWTAQLRSHLYSTEDDPKAARTGEEYRRAWGGQGLAPSDVVSGYAFRHAAAASMYADAGDVFDRLTDVRGYTGTHRHRFDDTGRGLGIAGRDNSYDYKKLVESVPVEAKKGAPALPVFGDFATTTPGPGAK